MSLFVRQSRGGNWDSVTIEGQTSIWEVDSLVSPEMGRLVAALHSSGAQGLSDMTFRVVSDWRLNKLGLKKKKTAGESSDTALNRASRHWTIEIKTVDDAIRLAKAFKDRDKKYFNQNEVMRQFAIALQEKRISAERVTAGLWKKLIDRGYLQVVAERPKEPDVESVPEPGLDETAT
jgi:hypothetical protein